MNDATEPNSPEMPNVQAWHIPRLVIAWVAALAMGVLVTVLVGEDARFSWLVLAVGVSTLISFALQLGTAERVGFITRLAFSVAGSVVIIAVIDITGLLIAHFA
ncbi:hypothetical protein ACXR2T_03870 [Leucobacter sp. HY1910]